MRSRPEVLAPAGSPECLSAAVAGGADAVYFGLRHFNARGRAENFRRADLPAQVRYLHEHGLKAYVVLNTLVHDDEYPKALDLAACAHAAGVDAVIIQDLGLWQALAEALPGLERHASTQMTVHHPSQIEVLARLGARRVILARELTLAEVTRCGEAAAAAGVEIEHFVHGALCYAFSGQCLMSNFAGCRSANRGTCAQNCRFDYQRQGSTTVDTELSMRDLQLLERVGELADAGVVSLKIEGRLKGPEYVYTVARAYREATEAWAARRRLPAAPLRERLRTVFARANDDAPLAGRYGPEARLHRYDPARDQPPDGTILALDRAQGTAHLAVASPVRAGQGFAFTSGQFNGGFLVIAADADGRGRWRVRVRIDRHGPPVRSGTPVWRNADHARRLEADQAMAQVPLPRPVEGVVVDLAISGEIGSPLAVTGRAADGRTATVLSAQPLAPAHGAGIDAAMLEATLGAFGGSGFAKGTLTHTLPPRAFLPQAQLKQLRRELVAQLQTQPLPSPAAPAAEPCPEPAPGRPRGRATRLHVAVGSLAAAQSAWEAGADVCWLDDAQLALWGPRPPVLPLPASAPGPEALWLRHPAVAPLSPHLAAVGLPVVAGHLGALAAAAAAGLPAIADASLNACSAATVRALAGLGAQGVVLSLECSTRDLARVLGRLAADPAPQVLLVAGGRLPAMLTRQEHGLEPGGRLALQASPADGGLPYELERRQHDTVVWEGRRLVAPTHVAPTAGLIDGWVLELADLPPAAVSAVVSAYRQLRDGALVPAAVEAVHAAYAPAGTFTGHLHQGSRELDDVRADEAAEAPALS